MVREIGYLAYSLVFSMSRVVSFFFFKQKTAYEMRISDWSSDVCSSDLKETPVRQANHGLRAAGHGPFFHSFRLMARFNASKSGRITADAVDQLKAYPIAPRSGIADQGF